MKRTLFIASACLFTLYACKKSAEGNKNVITEETVETTVTDNNGNIDSSTTSASKKTVDGKTVEEQTFVYSGLDNSKAKVTLIDSEKEHTLTIEANKRKYILDRKSVSPEKTVYERNTIRAEMKGDSLYIIQDDNVIPLKRSF